MSYPQVAKAFFEHYLPAPIKALADLDKLKLSKESYISEELKLAITDVLFKTKFSGHEGYFYVLVEHQQKPDKLMPFRLLKYIVAIIEQHIKTHPHAKLPIVYPLLFHTGENAYPYSLNLVDLFDGPKALAEQALYQPAQLIDVQQIPDEALKQQTWAGVMQLCMKYAHTRDALVLLREHMLHLLQALERTGGSLYVQSVLTYLLNVGDVSNSKAFLATIQHTLSPETGAAIMTIAQQIEAKGIEQGITLGREEGQLEAKEAIAKKMLQEGLALALVSQITGLSLEAIKELAASQNTASH